MCDTRVVDTARLGRGDRRAGGRPKVYRTLCPAIAVAVRDDRQTVQRSFARILSPPPAETIEYGRPWSTRGHSAESELYERRYIII